MLEALAPELGFHVRSLDLAEDPVLAARYRHAAPVVRARGITLLSGVMDTDGLRTEIVRAFGPHPLRDVPEREEEFLALLECPICAGDLESRPRAVSCLRCGKEYSREQGVLMLMDLPERESRLSILRWLGRLISFRLDGRGEARRAAREG